MVQLVADDFNRADGFPGTNWGSTASWTITSGALFAIFTNGDAVLPYSGILFPADQWSEVVVREIGTGFGSGTGMGASVRTAPADFTTYWAVGNPVGYFVAKFVSNSFTEIANVGSPTFADGDALRLEVRTVAGNAELKVYKNRVL